ncbi:uncharacterized protein L3040_009582 [Drepanopeziza brunnea f. sp. 'multigermtubi']|uniref:uncharacterized protein n=1 Tax=Drepanopeziza brunnea f. sp. 'multigermtubi' TaxID=698441 RepID=UPI002392F2EE|nr:hypothetical protein L3040_009582 [Drepanopeziza brunnea f. sp. 'multigermtubi']
MASYYQDDEVDDRDRRRRGTAPTHRHKQPVRFASPVAEPESYRWRRPEQRRPYARFPSEDLVGSETENRTSRSKSPTLQENNRQTSSPSPIPKPEPAGRSETVSPERSTDRPISPVKDAAWEPRSPQVPERASSEGSWNARNAFYPPGYSEYSDDDFNVRVRRDRSSPEPPYRSSSPPVALQSGSGYYSVNDHKFWTATEAFQDVHRGRKRERGQEWAKSYSGASGPSLPSPIRSQHRYRSTAGPVPSRGTSFYDEDEDLDVRVRTREPYRPISFVYPERRTRTTPRTLPSRGTSRYEASEDELDIGERRGQDIPAKVIYSEHRHRPFPRPYYPPPEINPSPRRSRREISPERSFSNNNRYYIYYGNDQYGNYSHDRRSRSRSPSAPVPPAAAPVIINNRIYNDIDNDDYLSLGPATTATGRSRPIISTAPLPVKNHIYKDYADEDYDALVTRLGEPDLGFITQAYQFSLSRHSKSLQGSDSDLGSISDTSERDEPRAQENSKKASESGKTYNMLRSQYIGEGAIGRPHSVQLTLMPEPVSTHLKRVSPVFRWVHFEDKNMDFEHFENNTLNIPGLTSLEQSSISKLLGRIYGAFIPAGQLVRGEDIEDFKNENNIVGLPPILRFAAILRSLWIKSLVSSDENPSPGKIRLDTEGERHEAGTMIVSCARPSMTALRGDSISVLPPPEPESPLLSPNILVSTKSSLLWALPLEECQSWFAFTSHFLEYWPLQAAITYSGKSIVAEDWPRLLLLAKKATIRLSLELQILKRVEPTRGTLLEDPTSEESAHKERSAPSPSLKPKDHQRHKNRHKNSSERSKEEFHVFTWMNSNNEMHNVSPGITATNVDYILSGFESQGLEDDLKEMDEYLSTEINLSHRLIYNAAPSKTRVELYELLSSMRKEAVSDERSTTPQIKVYEAVVDVVNAAEVLFRFFLPSNYEGTMVNKYWGAVYQLLKLSQSGRLSARNVSEVLDSLILLNQSTVPFAELFSQMPLVERSNAQIPEELTTAWLHLVLGLASCPKDLRLFDTQMTTCVELVEQGIRKAVMALTKLYELPNYAVFQPYEFALLIAFQLSRDDGGSSTEISDTYLEYLKSLQSDIEANPLDRNHQDRIVCLKQEIEVISETLDVQQYILRQAQRGFGASRTAGAREDADYPSHKLPPPYTHTRSFPALESTGMQSLIIQDSLALIENRIRGFREMREIASELGDWNIQKIDSNKDRQEAAIYAFTIVTIIFLPLGTIAGIMGMNTADIRAMPFRQWVYWATALPLTVTVIVLCLAWAGELNNFWAGLRRRLMWKRDTTTTSSLRDYATAAKYAKRYEETIERRTAGYDDRRRELVRSRRRSGTDTLFGKREERSYV